MGKITQNHNGGCFCGAVRYTLTGPPDWSSHCHCRSCQKAVGAAFTTWVGAKSENFKVTKGRITKCAWPGVERGFCGQCGTSLTYVAEEGWPGQVGILAPTLDDPEIASPGAHVYVEDQQPWVKLDDGLPVHQQFP
ncbi:MAG: GFA family protein [bacterium]